MLTHESKEALVEEFRRGTILAAALRVVGRKGVAGATMQQIADEAGIAKGTIYLYFPSREELIERLVEQAFSGLIDRIQSGLDAPGTLADRLRRLVRAQIEFFEENRQVLSVYMALRYGDVEAACESRRRRPSRPLYRRYLAMLTAVLEEAMRRNEIRRLDATRVAFFVSEGLSSLLLRRLSDPAPPIDTEVEWIVGLLLDGLATRRPA
jgi:TetR/AcrR family fatty acid metabolism transcriptional regulator